MTLEQALAYLETTARVSCPQITCEQAGEIAGLLRDLSDQHLARQRQAIDALMSERDDRERDGQMACGFAWDCGREMARLEECLQQCGLQAFMRNRSPEEVAGHMRYIADSWDLERKRLIDALCKRGECRHFVCPGKGIEPGEDFDVDDYAKTGRK